MKKLSVMAVALLVFSLAPSAAIAGDQNLVLNQTGATGVGFAPPSDLRTDTLVDQPVVPSGFIVPLNWHITNDPGNSLYLADDFTNGQPWVIGNIFVHSALTALDVSCVDSLTWQIYRDSGGVPAGDPAGGGNAPLWELELASTDPQVSYGYNDVFANFSTVRVDLEVPLFLPAGSYWLVFFPSMDSVTCGSAGRHGSTLSLGHEAVAMRPSGLYGIPATWTPFSETTSFSGIGYSDLAFRLGGEACPGANFDPVAGTLAIPQIMVDGSDTCYEAVMTKEGAGYEFSLAGAKKMSCTCPAATFTSATGILALSDLRIGAAAKRYSVELTKKVGGWVFVLSRIVK